LDWERSCRESPAKVAVEDLLLEDDMVHRVCEMAEDGTETERDDARSFVDHRYARRT
jgi:hypothetical protein